jgi:hypothetical protein
MALATLFENAFTSNTEFGWYSRRSGGGLNAERNAFTGSGAFGVFNESGAILDARNNWWGDASGPSGGLPDPSTNRPALGSGDAVGHAVRFDPWLEGPRPQIAVTAPTSGLVWQIGQTHTITWATTDILRGVKIFASLDGGAWTPIVLGTPNDGVFDWTVNLGPTPSARIRVTAMQLNSVYGESAPFTIEEAPAPAWIRVDQPTSATVWEKDSIQTIVWACEGVSSNVKIYANVDGGAWQLVAWDTPNDGVHDWRVSLAPSMAARVRVVSMSDNGLYGESPDFTISAPALNPSLTVTDPTGASEWPRDSQQTITWTSVDHPGNVKIYANVDGGVWQLVAWDTPNDGAHPWTIKLNPSNAARVRVVSMANNAVYGESPDFTISGVVLHPSITVTVPTGVSEWPVNSVQTITWTSVDHPGNVKIYARIDGGAWQLVVWDTPNDGAHPWTIKLNPSSAARVRVVSMANNAVFGESPDFTISGVTLNPSLTVTAPTGASDWARDSVQTIAWTSVDHPGNVKIYARVDGGVWQLVAWDTPNDGVHDWRVNVGPSSAARVRVVSMASNAVYGESPLFTIRE